MNTYTGINIQPTPVVDWKGLASLALEQRRQDSSLQMEQTKEKNRQSEATRAFADSHALLGQQIAASKAAMALSDVQKRTAELQLSTGVIQSEAAAKKAEADDAIRRIAEKKTARDSIMAFDNSEPGKELSRQQQALLASDANGDVMGAFEAWGNINKLATPEARKAAQNKMILAKNGEVNIGNDIILPETLGGMLQKRYDVGIMRNVDITTTNEIPPGTPDDVATAMKITANQKKSTPQSVLLSVPEMFQRLGSPQDAQDRSKISAFLYNNSSELQKPITAQKIKERIGEDAFNGMNIPGMTYDPKAPVKMTIAGKEVEMSEADFAEKQLKEAIIPKKTALDKVNLTGANTPDPIKGDQIVLNPDGTRKMASSGFGVQMYATDSTARDLARGVREDAKIVGGLFAEGAMGYLRPVGTFLGGLFGSDGTPDVFAPITERALTSGDISALDAIDKDMKNIIHIVRSDPRDRASLQQGMARYSSRYNDSLDIRKYGIDYVKARAAKEAADANAKLNASK